MADLTCRDCGTSTSYAGASIEDALGTCGDDLSVVRHSPVGPVMSGGTHNWSEE